MDKSGACSVESISRPRVRLCCLLLRVVESRTGKDGRGAEANKVALLVIWAGTGNDTAGSSVNMAGFGVERAGIVGIGVDGIDF